MHLPSISTMLGCLLTMSLGFTMPSSKSILHLESTDASTAVLTGKDHFWLAQDESNELLLFPRNIDSKPLQRFDVTPYLELQGTEVDIEASCRSPKDPNRIYWIGSMSNNKNGKFRPDRDRLFATVIHGEGASSKMQFAGSMQGLRQRLIEWGDQHGFALSQCAQKGVEPKRNDGFNVEGLEFSLDGKDLWIAFRAPLLGENQNQALIIPILHFEKNFPKGIIEFGKPILLDLGGRGFRSIGKNSKGEYLIVAGRSDAKVDFALYLWNGNPQNQPLRLNADLSDLAPEGIVDVPHDMSKDFVVQLLSDFGDKKCSQSKWIQVVIDK